MAHVAPPPPLLAPFTPFSTTAWHHDHLHPYPGGDIIITLTDGLSRNKMEKKKTSCGKNKTQPKTAEDTSNMGRLPNIREQTAHADVVVVVVGLLSAPPQHRYQGATIERSATNISYESFGSDGKIQCFRTSPHAWRSPTVASFRFAVPGRWAADEQRQAVARGTLGCWLFLLEPWRGERSTRYSVIVDMDRIARLI